MYDRLGAPDQWSILECTRSIFTHPNKNIDSSEIVLIFSYFTFFYKYFPYSVRPRHLTLIIEPWGCPFPVQGPGSFSFSILTTRITFFCLLISTIRVKKSNFLGWIDYMYYTLNGPFLIAFICACVSIRVSNKA